MGMAFLWLAGISVLLRNISYLIGLKNKNKALMETAQSMSPELANATAELIKDVKAEENK